jgi:hypothetical protein
MVEFYVFIGLKNPLNFTMKAPSGRDNNSPVESARKPVPA